METRKLVLYLALAIIAVMLWGNWNKFQMQKKHPQTVATQTTGNPHAAAMQGAAANNTNPAAAATAATNKAPAAGATPVAAATKVVDKSSWIYVNTDLTQTAIDLNGGNIVSVALNNYPQTEKKNSPPVKIIKSEGGYYVTQSGVITNGTPDSNIKFTSSKTNYSLPNGQDQVQVVLTGKTNNGLTVTKTYTFARNKYEVVVASKLTNTSGKAWTGNQYVQLVKRLGPEDQQSFRSPTFTGASISSPGDLYQKIRYSKLVGHNMHKMVRGGWLAFQQKYFLSAIVPGARQLNTFYSWTDGDGAATPYVYTLGYAAPQVSLAPKASVTNTTKIYVGPELTDRLALVAPHLDLTIDYGWLWWLSKPLYWVLEKINSIVGNWGWSIVLITLLIKLVLHPFTASGFKSQGKMKALSPKLKALKEKHGDDKQALSKATMDLYKAEKINPLGGCLPLLLQIPFFLALYYVLAESVALRHAPWIFWIHDLAAKDPYYILPVLMGMAMFVQQKLGPASPDPAQAKMMMFMPVVLVVLFLHFPAGLVLYWLVNNLATAAQMWWVNRHVKV